MTQEYHICPSVMETDEGPQPVNLSEQDIIYFIKEGEQLRLDYPLLHCWAGFHITWGEMSIMITDVWVDGLKYYQAFEKVRQSESG